MKNNLGEVWQRTSLVQRVLLLCIGLACAGAAVLLVNWARKPHLVLLYSNLAPAEAAKISEKVRDSDMPYELKEGGTSIYVPEDKVYSLRLTMAQQNLPTSEQAGYRILDEERIGASPFSQHINYARALEGELAKSIKLIDGVVHARVHAVIPERSVLSKQEKEASATVVLQLKTGWRFNSGNVAAVVHMVAGAIPGLTPEHVVVVDSAGEVLAGSGNNDFAGGSGNFLDYKAHVESYLGRKAEDMLTAVLGPGRASVRVDAVLDIGKGRTVTEKIDPAGRVVVKEKITAIAGGAGGSPGATKDDSTESTYMVGKTTEERELVPGAVKSLSVAAFVDLTGASEPNGPAAATLKKEDAEEIIRSALGISKTDIASRVTVVDAPFHKIPESPDAKVTEAGLFSKDFLLEVGKSVSLGVLVIGALLMLKIFGGSSKKKMVVTAAGSPELAGGGGENLLAADGESDPDVVRARITRALQENPEEVKRLFLSWVESDKGEV